MDKQNSSSRKKISLSILFFYFLIFQILTGSVFSQELIWAKREGGASNESSFDIKIDSNGNIYVVGHYSGTVNFGAGEANQTTLSSVESVDIFIAKYDSEGSLLWAKSAGGSKVDQGFGIEIDQNNDIYISGLYDIDAVFGAGEANETVLDGAGDHAAFIAKYNSNGMLIWAKKVGGNSANTRISGISLDNSGEIYLAGFFSESTTFGEGGSNETTLTPDGIADVYVAKYNSEGLLLWVKQVKGPSFDFGSAVVTDASGNCYATGAFQDSAVFGFGEANEVNLTGLGNYDIFLAKYNSDGVLQWAKIAGGSEFDLGSGISLDNSGNIYLTGYFEDNCIFGANENNEATISSAGERDAYIAKYNQDGLLLWIKHFGGTDNDQGVDIAADALGNSYLTGYFEQTAILGSGEVNETVLESSGDQDMFFAKYDPNGSLLKAVKAGGNKIDQGVGIEIDESGNSYITGNFEGVATFGDGESNETVLRNVGNGDIFIAKFGAVSPTSAQTTFNIKDDFKLAQNYPNPFNPITTIYYYLPEQANVKIKIFDMFGSEIKELENSNKNSGEHLVRWDGTNNSGNKVVSGHYFYQIITDNFRSVKKMTLLK